MAHQLHHGCQLKCAVSYAMECYRPLSRKAAFAALREVRRGLPAGATTTFDRDGRRVSFAYRGDGDWRAVEDGNN